MTVMLSATCHRSTTDLIIPATRLLDARLSARYSATLTAHGGMPPYHWRIAIGDLPKGLKLNMATGEIFGTPAEVGSFAFTVEATDTIAPKAHRSAQSIVLNVVERKRSRTPMGPLTVSLMNPRYFADGNGQVVYLTGSHHWNNLQDAGRTDPPPRFDYEGYLAFLRNYNHNFMRMWTNELTKYVYATFPEFYEPFPWLRTGPGMALDGKLKFDLRRFNQAYFERLRSRVIAARDSGIYVSIMLFAAGVEGSEPPWRWDGHPFNVQNNVNGINGDANGDGQGIEVHTLQVPAVIAVQEAYVAKVVDTVNDLDNVLYEICNESGVHSVGWQYHMIRFIKSYEADKAKQHPVGMTATNHNATLFFSQADWLSPGGGGGYDYDPPAADGRKVVISDTDHLFGTRGGGAAWVWKSFVRGLNPIYMDTLDSLSRRREGARRAMGHARVYAERMDLIHMAPRGDLASSGYCLANPGREYLIYLPAGGKVAVDLSGSSWTFTAEWFNPDTAEIASGGTVAGGGRRAFEAPFSGHVVLYLVRSG